MPSNWPSNRLPTAFQPLPTGGWRTPPYTPYPVGSVTGRLEGPRSQPGVRARDEKTEGDREGQK